MLSAVFRREASQNRLGDPSGAGKRTFRVTCFDLLNSLLGRAIAFICQLWRHVSSIIHFYVVLIQEIIEWGQILLCWIPIPNIHFMHINQDWLILIFAKCFDNGHLSTATDRLALLLLLPASRNPKPLSCFHGPTYLRCSSFLVVYSG